MAAGQHTSTGVFNDSKAKRAVAAQKDQTQVKKTTLDFDTDLDEFVTCSQSFKKLKELVQ